MTILRLITGCWIAACALTAQTQCLTVTGAQILGKDIARAISGLGAIPRSTPLAPSPLVGGSRVFSTSELRSLASRFSIVIGNPQEVCFRYATEALNRNRMEEAMRNSLQMTDARIEILDTSSGVVPVGTIEFTRENLNPPAAPDQHSGEMWTGNIVYGANQRFEIWAKVRVTAPVRRLVAVDTLRSGVAVRPEQLRVEIAEGFPLTEAANLSADRIAGMTPLRSITAGTEVRIDNLVRPNAVNRGDLVQVEVRFGGARLALTGRAESAGHVGDMVAVRNPETSKLFQALIEGTGRVFVGQPGAEPVHREGY